MIPMPIVAPTAVPAWQLSRAWPVIPSQLLDAEEPPAITHTKNKMLITRITHVNTRHFGNRSAPLSDT